MKKHRYYKTCPECGANLDPEERCDCKLSETEFTAAKIVLYLCDKKQCNDCSSRHYQDSDEVCNFTSDIAHAINFKLLCSNIYVEKE